MTLSLTTEQASRLADAAEALLSPAAGPEPGAWWTGVEEKLRLLFPGVNVMLSVPGERRVACHSESIEGSRLARVSEFTEIDGARRFRNRDPVIEAWLAYRTRHRVQSWRATDAIVAMRHLGFDLSRSAFYQDGLLGARLHDYAAIATPPEAGDWFLQIGYDRPGRSRFGDDLPVLELLRPAFRAGHHALASFAARQSELGAMLDAAADALLVVGADGRELHRSVALRRALAEEPERERVVASMGLVAASVRVLALGGSLGGGRGAGAARAVPAAEQTVVTARGRYVARASIASEAVWGRAGVVLVSLAVSTSVDPSEDVVRRFALTAREAEVARLLARRLSNAELAGALGVSPHTARHHTEKVMQKLGVHSRKELALCLNRESRVGSGE